MLFLQIQLTPFQAGLILGAILGALIGLIPLIFGVRRKNIGLGVIGFAGSIIGNAFLGILLSIPIAAVCTYLILKKNEPVDVRAVNEKPIDVKINNSENS